MSENQQQYKALALFSLLALTPSSFVTSSYTITSTAVSKEQASKNFTLRFFETQCNAFVFF